MLFGALSVTVSDTVRLNIDRGEGGGGVHLLPTVSYLAGRWTAGRGEGLVADSVERRAPPRACRLVVASARFRQMSGGRARPAAGFRGLLARSTAHSLPPLPGLWLVTACRSPSLHRHCRGPSRQLRKQTRSMRPQGMQGKRQGGTAPPLPVPVEINRTRPYMWTWDR